MPRSSSPKKIGELLRAIDSYHGHPPTQALKLAPLLFVRPGELREPNGRKSTSTRGEWRIPAARMKMREQHIVPLRAPSCRIFFASYEPSDGRGRYVFPSPVGCDRPMSENSLTAALRRMGYTGDEMTWQASGTIASYIAQRAGWNPDLIELQWPTQSATGADAYNRAQRLGERRKMMQAWADYLDALKASSNVVSLRRTA